MPSDKPKIVIRTEKDIIEKFNTIALEDNRSMSNLGEKLIKDYIKEYESRNGEITVNIRNIGQNNGTININ